MTLSEKPVDGDYSLFTQADRTERVLSSHDVGPAVIVAHDVGDTVAAELLHRHNDRLLLFDVVGCALTNGSIFIDLVQLSEGERALLALGGVGRARPDRRALDGRALARAAPSDR